MSFQNVSFHPGNKNLIEQLNKGDEKAFESIYNQYTPPLFAFATQYLSKEKAEGVIQETMLWLWQNRASIISEMSLKSLLFTIVKNKCLNQINRQQLKSKILEEITHEVAEKYENPDFYFEQELIYLFREALHKMPSLFREAFEMSRFGEMTHKEIAASLNVSRQTVNYRLSKALDYLRNELKDYLPVMLFLLP